MIVKIDDKLQIGVLEYRIVYNDKVLKLKKDLAYVNYDEQKIVIPNIRDGRHLSDEAKTIELLHEILHAIGISTAVEINERDAIAISNMLAQVLKTLGMTFSFANISDE